VLPHCEYRRLRDWHIIAMDEPARPTELRRRETRCAERRNAVLAARDFLSYGEYDLARRICASHHITRAEIAAAPKPRS
jgi:hypothetical protein